jgi:hypothetical protein
MDKDKHIIKEINQDEIEKLIKEKFNFDDIIGHKITFSIVGFKSDDGWRIDADADLGMSLNGIDWASASVPASIGDEDYDSALASVMLELAAGLNDLNLLATMRYLLNNQRDSGFSGAVIQ